MCATAKSFVCGCVHAVVLGLITGSVSTSVVDGFVYVLLTTRFVCVYC